MSGIPHYFIAIQLSEAIQEYFSNWEGELKQRLPYKQWTTKQDLHITLKFLGPVDDNKLSTLKSELANNLNDIAKISILVGTIGTFGKPDRPRVLFADVQKTSSLLNLQKNVEKSAGNAGFIKEKRPYKPHITLAKKWNGEENQRFSELLDVQDKKYRELQSMLIEEVVLFKIHPEQNPKYEIIDRYILK
ncbi:RNA 2',3'-cyclic phosphodiesterase [Oceanobacillus sp. 143]|uniref:RNA 2',3'-cyclic phosphodiesterase n=1 Tax=Oceanobacillus zhaokaii TaxID=2052660 RepID=A0A345PFS4_9BACI|nr:RNA 2',3'-cyclic phosphodiesterase [Oceanobacillus zhaokaii]AXI08854.1 RNA 2',3'-cyclic phosphodiesterase [Oceanobacillus zhaokaii]QGS68538.1 RNA 2',3'-cyclic phosphodiesterase [Oceanobacillus sp. 143]